MAQANGSLLGFASRKRSETRVRDGNGVSSVDELSSWNDVFLLSSDRASCNEANIGFTFGQVNECLRWFERV